MLALIIFRLLPIELVLLAGLVGIRLSKDRFTKLRQLPDMRFTPHVIGILSMLVVWYVWGSLHQVPVIHDEASYLLQAETFAAGRWVMPSPPLPQFFEQFHVFVTPTFSSKYPPGHAILMVPGIWLNLPGLIPLLLNGIAAALLFILVRRVTNGWVALLTVVLWLPMNTNLVFRPSYFSENTTSVLWLLGWWALLEWRATGREKWLMVVAASVGWMAITRPLTALAYALPVAVVVIWEVARRHNWRQLVRPALVGVVIVSLLPISSAKDTGSWRVSPYSLYAKDYIPFDKLGFGLDSTKPRRTIPADMKPMAKLFGPVHAAHTPSNLPRILYDRWHWMFVDAFGGNHRLLALFAVLSVVVLPAAAWFAVGGSFLLTLTYLSYAHDPGWAVYYLEIIPLFPFLTACGVWAVWIALSRREKPLRLNVLQTTTPQAAFAGLIMALLWLVPGSINVDRAEKSQARRRAYQVNFSKAVASLPESRTVIFVRYAPWHVIHTSLITNRADLQKARTWFVYDRGAEDSALMALAPDRTPYLYEDQTATFTRMVAPQRQLSSNTSAKP